MVLLDTFGYPTTDRTGTYAFFRRDDRHSTKRRTLDCGHTIDATEPYLYIVGKLWGEQHVFQWSDCDVCRRRGNAY